MDVRELASVVGLETVWVIHDLEANTYGIAALGAEDMALLCYLLSRFKGVSWEDVLSGLGLHNIYVSLRDTERGVETSLREGALYGMSAWHQRFWTHWTHGAAPYHEPARR